MHCKASDFADMLAQEKVAEGPIGEHGGNLPGGCREPSLVVRAAVYRETASL